MEQKLIFIDLDGTLTPQSSWLLINTMLGITPEEDQTLFDRYVNNDLQYNDWTKELVRLHKEHEPKTRADFMAVVESVELRPDAQETITALKAKGYRTVLISGSVDVVVEAVAKKIGCDDWLACTKVLFDDTGVFVDFVSLGDEGPAKLALATVYCEQQGFNLPEAIVVGDGGNEKDLFEVAKGILLGSKESLKPLAWKQINSLSEIPMLI